MFPFVINKPEKEVYNDLIVIWETSVRATHHFLKEEDFLYYKNLIAEKF